MSKPKVYVGTWRKYNNGSIKGGWLSLCDCKDYQDFLKRCHALHKDERDPEYMIQDCEDFPDGLGCGEWLSEQEFNDVMQAVKEEADADMADAIRRAAEAMLNIGKTAPKGKAAKADDKALLEEYMSEMVKVWGNDSHMLDFERKEFSSAVRLQNGGIVVFEKPSMEHRFCFHDEGPDYEFYKHITSGEERLKEYFLDENLRKFDNEIKALENNMRDENGEYIRGYYCKEWYITRKEYSGQREPLNLYDYHAIHHSELDRNFYKDAKKMSDADRKTILEGVKHEREKFNKRLQAYLKRYGTSKIHTWTYWADA